MAFKIDCHAIGVWMLLACSIGFLVLSFTYFDVRTFSNTRQESQSLSSLNPSSLSSSSDNDLAELEPVKDLRNVTVESGTFTADYSQQETVASNRSVAGCDISQGKWVFDETYPLYQTKNCPFVDPGFRCEENGRPDSDFTKFRWQPRDCDLPRFDAAAMLERLRDQQVAFVGDSLGRNQWESMLCMLAEGVQDKSRIYETNGQPITKHMGHLVFRFQDYNLTVEYYREPFLVPQTSRPPLDSPSNVTTVLILDQVAWTVKYWSTANILVLNTGHWWLWERTLGGGGRFQVGKNFTNDSLEEGFQIAMSTWALWMEDNIDQNMTQVFFRSYSPKHFIGGEWNSGGHCDGEPLSGLDAQETKAPWTNKYIVDAINQKVKSKRGSVEFLNITTSTSYRADGHPGAYSDAPRGVQDCSHFCLPGVPDSWNELLFASLPAKGQPPCMH